MGYSEGQLAQMSTDEMISTFAQNMLKVDLTQLAITGFGLSKQPA
jgi:hypothetical protein